MEPLARGLLSEKTNQFFREDKHPNANGPDIELAGQVRMNLLKLQK
jgi:hypothetical protein